MERTLEESKIAVSSPKMFPPEAENGSGSCPHSPLAASCSLHSGLSQHSAPLLTLVCVCVHMCVYVRMCVCAYVCVCGCVRACVHACVWACICACHACAWGAVCMCVYMCVCVCTVGSHHLQIISQ